MRKPTGQMQEETQKYLDDYNTLYNWEYNDMCRFIENYSEEEFVEHTMKHITDFVMTMAQS